MKSYLVIFLTLLVSGLNFLYGILNTRFLGLGEIGLYSLMIQSINTLILISDLGLSTTFLKFYSEAYGKDKKRSDVVLRNSLYIKTIIAAFLILFLLIFIEHIDKYLGENVKKTQILALFSTVFTISISELLMSKYRSQGRFRSFFIYKFFMAFMRIIPMGIFYSLGRYNLGNSINIFVYSTLIILLLLFVEQREIFSEFSWDKFLLKELFHFSKWIFVSNMAIAFLINGTIELYYLKTFSEKEELSYFSALLIFFTVLSVLSTSITTLFFPKLAGITKENDFFLEMKKANKLSFLLSLPLILIIPFMKLFIKIILGTQYLAISLSGSILFFGFFIELNSQIYRLVLYLKANKKIAFINLYQFGLSIATGYLFIKILDYGALGACISIFIIRVAGAIAMRNEVRKIRVSTAVTKF